MGKTPDNVTTNSTQTNRTVLDPQIKALLMGNVDMANILTSGMLPYRPANNTSGNYGGALAMPVEGPGGYWDTQTGAWTPGTPQSPMTPGFAANGLPYDPNGDAGQILNPDGTPYIPPSSFTPGFDPMQTTAQNDVIRIGQTPIGRDQLGGNVYDRFTNFMPTNIDAVSLSDFGEMTPVGMLPQASANNFTDLNFEKYLMPGREQVIDPLKSYFGEMSDRAVANTASQGRMGSAVRGTNDAIREGLVRGEMQLQSSPVLSQALQGLYGTSANLAVGDLNRQADISKFNTSNAVQAKLAEFAARNQRNIVDATHAQQANITNVENLMRSPMIAMDAAGRGATATTGARDLSIDNARLVDAVGAQRRGLAEQRIMDPFRAFALRSGAVAGAVPSFTSTSATGSNTGPSPYGSSGGAAGALGGTAAAAGIANMAGMFGTAGTAGAAATAASPWLWPLLLGGAAIGGLS